MYMIYWSSTSIIIWEVWCHENEEDVGKRKRLNGKQKKTWHSTFQDDIMAAKVRWSGAKRKVNNRGVLEAVSFPLIWQHI